MERFVYTKLETEVSPWVLTRVTDVDAAVKRGAMFRTWNEFEELPTSDDKKNMLTNAATRFGDLVLDFDSSVVAESLRDTIACVKKLHEAYGVNPDSLRLYFSGSKGFHCVIPREIVGSSEGSRILPLVYKSMVEAAFPATSFPTLDRSMYAMGKGKMFRIANVKRSKGTHKIPLTWKELSGGTAVSTMINWSKNPRQEVAVLPPTLSPGLSALYLSHIQKMSAFVAGHSYVRKSDLKGLPARTLTRCMNILLNQEGKAEGYNGSFNQICFSALVPGLKAAGFSLDEARDTVCDFMEKFEDSTGYPTFQDRMNHFSSVWAYDSSRVKPFSCGAMHTILGHTALTCNTCPVHICDVFGVSFIDGELETLNKEHAKLMEEREQEKAARAARKAEREKVEAERAVRREERERRKLEEGESKEARAARKAEREKIEAERAVRREEREKRRAEEELLKENRKKAREDQIRVRKEELEAAKAATSGSENSKLDEMNRRFALLTIKSREAIVEEYEDGTFNILTLKAFQTIQANNTVVTYNDKGQPKTTNMADLWLTGKHRKTYQGICFKPNGGPDNLFNTWRGFSLPHTRMSATEAKEKCRRYREHVENIICNRDEKLIYYVWRWLADLVQNPGGKKPGVALILKGGKGAGKSLFMKPFYMMLKNHFMSYTNRSYFFSNFNSSLEDKLLVFLDEAFWAGDKAGEGFLKGFITEPTTVIERKGYDGYSVDSYARVVMASNEDWVVPASGDERRFCVLEVSDEKARDYDYFNKLVAEIEGEGAEALLTWLMSINISDFNAKLVPATDALKEQKSFSLNSVGEWWMSVLETGQFELDQNICVDWEERLDPALAMKAYSRWCKSQGRRAFSVSRFRKNLFGKHGMLEGAKLVTVRNSKGKYDHHYVVESLESQRETFGICYGDM